MKVPWSYELKRIAPKHAHKFWHPEMLAGIQHAPVYLFPDQAAFDSDEVDLAARALMDELPRLPHAAVIFEVPDQNGTLDSQVVYARQVDDAVECAYFHRDKATGRWTDIIVHGRFSQPGIADVELNPRTAEDNRAGYAQAATGIVWRALGILASNPETSAREVPRTRRPKLERAGVSGWTWTMVSVDPEQVKPKSPSLGGTHASPRWHIRRGHWRNLPDGRRVFVRECEVGDMARGGVVKDYEVAA
jgi:hypothetical protein